MSQFCEQSQGHETILTRRLTVRHREGLHVRPSAAIVETVNHFQADVVIHYGNQQGDASDVFDIMVLCVPDGANVVFEAEGPDARWALRAIAKLFAADFGLK